MSAWVALLRGVNVGGITVRNADLAGTASQLGFGGVRTILASGNVVFEDAEDSSRASIKGRFEAALRERFDYDAWIILITPEELSTAITSFPFSEGDPERQPYAIFCVDRETVDELLEGAASLDGSVDPVAAVGNVVYWHPAKGTSVGTPFAKLLARPRFKARTTNRNLRTLRKIAG